MKWQWTQGDKQTHAELHIAGELGESDSVLYHGADWPMNPEHKRLIAAAPELLEACKCLELDLTGACELLGWAPDDEDIPESWVLSLKEATAAIAKATD